MEIIVLCVIAFVVWKMWARNRALNQAALDSAWHEALFDPNYSDLFKRPTPPTTEEEWNAYDRRYWPSTDAEWRAYDQRYEERKQKRKDKGREHRTNDAG